MDNAATPDGRGQERPHDAQPLFPSEGAFNPVVPLSEIDGARAPAPLVPVDPADVGKPAEAEWAREAHRAGRKEDEEATLVPSRARRPRAARPSWFVTAGVIALSVAAGLASGAYLIWSSQRDAAPPVPAQVAAEAPAPQTAPPSAAPTPAPVVEKVEAANESAKVEKSDEVIKAESPREAARPSPTPRAERPARAAAEENAVTREPRPARTQSAPQARPRPATAERRPPASPSSARALPISTPPPAAKSKKVIQWP
jgi:hypothetical protein